MIVIVASLAGSLGAVFRYVISGLVQEAWSRDFPLGTLVVNLAGAFGLGVLVGSVDVGSVPGVAAVGFLGGFTTFSTWMVETLGLGTRSVGALINLGVTLVGGVGAAALGYIVAG